MRMSDWSSDVCSSDLLTGLRFGMARQYPVGGLAGLTRGSEDRAIILAQHGQPRRQIIGVAHGRDDAEGGAKAGAAHFSDQFLAGIVFAAKGIEQFTVEPRDMAAGMTRSEERRVGKE